MENQLNEYSEKFNIRAYEIDSTGRASIISIGNYLQEIAGNHAGILGVSVDKLFKKKLTWVLSRLHFQIDIYPKWRDEITIHTWPSGVHGKFAIRDFEILSSDNKIIGRATTSWMLIDLVKLKPISMPDFITSIHLSKKERSLDDNFEKIPGIDKINYSKKFNVRLSDLDINQHVNNVNYIEWAIESLPLEIRKIYQLSGFEISFRAESKYGDVIVAETEEIDQNNQKIFVHKLVEQSSQKELAIARSYWNEMKRKI